MEDGKFWPPLLILAILVVSAFIYRYLEMVDKANASLETARLIYSQSQESLRLRKERWETLEKASLKMTAELAARQEMTLNVQAALDLQSALQDEADKKERTIKNDLVEIVKSTQSAVGRVRAAAVGTVIPELILKDGRALKSGRILKVGDSSISFGHSEGITSVPADQLPLDMVERYDLGNGSLTLQLEQLEASILGSTASDLERQAVELAGLSKNIASMQVAFDAAEMRAKTAEDKVISYDRQITEAELNQQPTFNLRTMRDLAEGSAGQARNELRKLKAELEKLKAKEGQLRNQQ